jgi:hypothetical protein
VGYLQHCDRMCCDGDRPAIVCLCGSTRFWRTFQEASLKETLRGHIVLSIGCATGTDDDHFGGYMPEDDYDAVKQRLDALHKRKIDLADEVLILNVEDYIGESTRSELAHARAQGKRIRWWQASYHRQDGEMVDLPRTIAECIAVPDGDGRALAAWRWRDTASESPA